MSTGTRGLKLFSKRTLWQIARRWWSQSTLCASSWWQRPHSYFSDALRPFILGIVWLTGFLRSYLPVRVPVILWWYSVCQRSIFPGQSIVARPGSNCMQWSHTSCRVSSTLWSFWQSPTRLHTKTINTAPTRTVISRSLGYFRVNPFLACHGRSFREVSSTICKTVSYSIDFIVLWALTRKQTGLPLYTGLSQ